MKQKKLDNDTSRCASYNCPYRENCLRFTYKRDGEYVPYNVFGEQNDLGKCKFFIKA